MCAFDAFEFTHAAPQSLRLKARAFCNMLRMSVTLDTSHFEMSWLKATAFWNIAYMFVTLDTAHFEISWLKAAALWNI